MRSAVDSERSGPAHSPGPEAKHGPIWAMLGLRGGGMTHYPLFARDLCTDIVAHYLLANWLLFHYVFTIRPLSVDYLTNIQLLVYC